jgi:hypothetical protein
MTLDSPVGSGDHFMPTAAIINGIINNPDQSNIMNLTQLINVSYNRTGSRTPRALRVLMPAELPQFWHGLLIYLVAF